MELTPAPAGADPMFLIKPFTFAVDLYPRAVDQQVQGLVPLDPLRQHPQSATTPAERGVVRDRQVNIEQADNRSHRSLGLTQRLVKHQAKGQTGLNRHV